MTKAAQISDTSRGDFTLRNEDTTRRTKRKDFIQIESHESMLYKLLQGKKIEKIECSATNCYNIDVNSYPSMQEMEDRAEILAKLLILYNRDEYPMEGDVGVGVNRRESHRAGVTTHL